MVRYKSYRCKAIILPLGESHLALNNPNNSYWLIALLWKAMLNKALTNAQIPKGYESVTRNQKNYRGRLALSKHIRRYFHLTRRMRGACTSYLFPKQKASDWSHKPGNRRSGFCENHSSDRG